MTQKNVGDPTPAKAPRRTAAEKQELALELAKARYELRRATRWPYALIEDRQYKFKGPDRNALRADLREAWRGKYDEAPPPDTALNSVIDDLKHIAEKVDPDPESAEDAAALLLARNGISRDPDGWDAEDAARAYEVRKGSLGWFRPAREGGTIWTALATFDAEITDEVIRDDGAEEQHLWTVRVTTAAGRSGTVQITPDQLGSPQRWAAKAVGVSALVMPGQMVADHLRVAVQSRSSSVASRTIYAHTGWRRLDGRWAYLTSSGALGADGLDESVTVDLGSLSGYALTDATDATAVREAVRVSIDLLSIAPEELTAPLLAAVYRAPLPLTPDCAVWIYGRSGAFKTAFTALGQQHYGASMDAQHLPGNWTSTANMLETQAFMLDSALFVVDDYSPDATKVDSQRRAATADRLIRGSANHSGRGRLRPDGTQRPVRPPRAQLLTSAEDIPPGVESLRARTLICEVSPGMVLVDKLTAAQAAAADGTLALAMSGYVSWLARRYDADGTLPAALAGTRDAYRDKARDAGHPRYALNVASLAVGWHEFLIYAAAVGAVTGKQGEACWERTWRVLCAVGAGQERYRRDADPVSVYLSALTALVASRRAHLAARKGTPPVDPGRWGWEETGSSMGPFWRPKGELIGWIDGDDVYLEPDAAFRAARMFAESSGRSLSLSADMLHKHLRERGLLATSDSKRTTARYDLGGQRSRRVLHMTLRSFEQRDDEPGDEQ